LSRGNAASDRERVLHRWCEAIDGALKAHEGVKNIRWYDQSDFDRDQGATWAESP
jgi:hypothetical protein